MSIIKVSLKESSYNIVIGSGIINSLGRYLSRLRLGRDSYVITNALIKNKYDCALSKALKDSGFSVRFKTIPDTERSKSLEMAASILKDIARYDKKRQVFIIAFGGGVVGDLAGFIASVYKRGIPYAQVPTTLLAQVDSSIGGKTGVDLVEGKNLAGAFYQPALVFSDLKFLRSLSQRQLRCGLAEIIKYALIKDERLFFYLEKHYKGIFAFEEAVLGHIVSCCSKIKAGIVQQDEKERKGIRTVLNFGHTIGHALEAACNYEGYNHGEAIGCGMLAASDISRALNLISRETCERIESLIKIMGLPVEIKGVSSGDIIKACYHDKKFIGAKNRFVLIKDIGKAVIRDDVPLGIIRDALKVRIRD